MFCIDEENFGQVCVVGGHPHSPLTFRVFASAQAVPQLCWTVKNHPRSFRCSSSSHCIISALVSCQEANPNYSCLSSCKTEVAQSCRTLCDTMDCSLPGSSVHELLQARVLEWVATPSSTGSSQPRDQTQVSRIAGRCFTVRTTREATEFLFLQSQRNSKASGA